MRAFEPLQTNGEPGHSLVLPFAVDWSAMDARAHAGVELLLDDARRRFYTPALQSRSLEELLELWHTQAQPMFELVRATSTLLVVGLPGERVTAQLFHADRRAADELAQGIAQLERPDLAARVREANVLLSRARACASEAFADRRESPADALQDFLVGNVVWSIGTMTLQNALGSWLPGVQPRADLFDELTHEFVEAGALEAGLAALDLRDVEIDDDDSLFDAIADASTTSFLLEALRRVREHFGPAATVAISHFVEPDFEAPPSRHFCIETALPPADACSAFERFCVDWWDAAVAESGVEIHPILDVAR